MGSNLDQASDLPSAESAVAVVPWEKQMDAMGVAGQVRLPFPAAK